MVSRRIVVTNSGMNGKVLSKLHFRSVYGVNVTRISRQGMDLFASNNYRFQVGDRIMVVGFEENVQRVAELMGNSERRLNAPNIATIFVGVVVGILFGSLPLAIPGIARSIEVGFGWWSAYYSYFAWKVWPSYETCNLYYYVCKYDVTRNWLSTILSIGWY